MFNRRILHPLDPFAIQYLINAMPHDERDAAYHQVAADAHR